MHRISKLAGLGAAALLAVALASPAFAFSPQSGTVLDISADPAPGVCAVERIWAGWDNTLTSPGTCPTTGVGSCPAGKTGDLCNRAWLSNVQASLRGGYQSHTENSSGFPGFLENSTMYIFWEQVTNRSAGNYVGYYHLAGGVNSTGKTSKVVDENCSGTVSTSCFVPGTNTRHAPAELHTRVGTLSNLNGFSAIPSPRVGSVSGANVSLNWDAAQMFLDSGAVGETITYKVYRLQDANGNNVCDPPAENAAGWTLLGDAPGTSFTDTTAPAGGDCLFYALKLVVNQPGHIASGADAATGQLVGTYRGAASQGVSRNPSASQVVNFGAKYVGKNTIRSSWGLALQGSVTGFYVSRSSTADGAYTRVSPLIPATGDGTSYSFDDKVTRKEGLTFYYKLEVMAGDTVLATNGPVNVTLRATK